MSNQGKRLIKSKGEEIKTHGKIGQPLSVTYNPNFLKERNEIFEKLFKNYQEELKNRPSKDIEVTIAISGD